MTGSCTLLLSPAEETAFVESPPENGRDARNALKTRARAIEEAAQTLGADPDFLWFVLAWYGVIHLRVRPPSRIPDAIRRQIRRRVRREETAHGRDWRPTWEACKAGWKEDRRKLREIETLFWLVAGPRRAHRPRNDAELLACAILRCYFEWLDGTPHMEIVGRIVFPGRTPKSVAEYWSRHKARAPGDADAEMRGLWGWYAVNREGVVQALKGGVPVFRRAPTKPAPVVPPPPRPRLSAATRRAARSGEKLADVLAERRRGPGPGPVAYYEGSCPRCGRTPPVVLGAPGGGLAGFCIGATEPCGTWVELRQARVEPEERVVVRSVMPLAGRMIVMLDRAGPAQR